MTDMPDVEAMDVKGLCEDARRTAWTDWKYGKNWGDGPIPNSVYEAFHDGYNAALSTLSRELAEARAERDYLRNWRKEATEIIGRLSREMIEHVARGSK